MEVPRADASPPPLLRQLLEQLAAEQFATDHEETSGTGTLEFSFRQGTLREWRPLPGRRPAKHLPRPAVEAV